MRRSTLNLAVGLVAVALLTAACGSVPADTIKVG